MTFSDITTGLQTGITAAGAVTAVAGLDISGVTGDATIKLSVASLTAGKQARIAFEDSVNGFTAAVPVAIFNPKGAISGIATKAYSLRKYQVPGCRFGVTSAVLRVNVLQIDASSSLSLHAWLET